MKHLQAHKGQYRFRSGEQGEVIEVECYYSKGGRNYFSENMDERGIFVSICPVTIRGGMVSMALLDGIRALVMPLNRKSDKALLAAAIRMDDAVPEAVNLYASGQKREAIRLLQGQAVPVAV